MAEPTARVPRLLGRTLPTPAGSYGVDRLLTAGLSYATTKLIMGRWGTRFCSGMSAGHGRRTRRAPARPPTTLWRTHFRENIWDEISDAIGASDFTIAVAGPGEGNVPNPNVTLEIGYARALHKPVLLSSDAPDTLPFDLRTQRALRDTIASVGGGEFHRELVSFIAGIVARCVRDDTAQAE